MFDETVAILENKRVNAEYYKLTFHSKRIAKFAQPGQFLNVQIETHSDPFLRRPFSFYRVQGAKVELLYEILGRGTELLSQKAKGASLRVLGPLGIPFTKNLKGRKRVLVAGGVGVPPLVFLAEQVKQEKKHSVLMIGCRSKAEVLPRKELANLKSLVEYATDDGSFGSKGFVTVLLEVLLQRENPKNLFIQTCGPHAMMAQVIHLAKKYGVEGEASIDERMACGVGACLGCVVETTDGFKTSCVEGPVFSFSNLLSS